MLLLCPDSIKKLSGKKVPLEGAFIPLGLHHKCTVTPLPPPTPLKNPKDQPHTGERFGFDVQGALGPHPSMATS